MQQYWLVIKIKKYSLISSKENDIEIDIKNILTYFNI